MRLGRVLPTMTAMRVMITPELLVIVRDGSQACMASGATVAHGTYFSPGMSPGRGGWRSAVAPRISSIPMITGSLRNQVDRIWDAFWSGGISTSMTVIEQFTYLLFLRQLDDRQAAVDFQRSLGATVTDVIPAEKQHLRWRELMQIPDGAQRRDVIDREVFPFLREGLGSDSFAQHMRNATFGIDNAGTLLTVMELIDQLTFPNKDIAGDLYEYMLSKLAASGTNGQFRTVSHIIDLMVNLMEPKPTDRIIDPACGTAGFLIGAAEWTKHHHKDALLDTRTRDHFYGHALTGFDFDTTMVRIAAMNMFMHGFESPNISYGDSLQQLPAEHQEAFDVVLANPPFAGSIDATSPNACAPRRWTHWWPRRSHRPRGCALRFHPRAQGTAPGAH